MEFQSDSVESYSDSGAKVLLYIYDLSQGMAAIFSPTLLGQRIEGVWHTSVVVFGREYFFSGSGVHDCEPGTSAPGGPVRVQTVGRTQVPRALFLNYLAELRASSYAGSRYQLLLHNCNNFSDEVCYFLCGRGIPAEILELPQRALTPPLFAALQSASAVAEAAAEVAAAAAREASPDYERLNAQVDEAREASAALAARRTLVADKAARRQRKLQRRPRDPARRADDADMSECEATATLPSATSAADDEREEERREEAERRARRAPPVVFAERVSAAEELEALEAALLGGSGGSGGAAAAVARAADSLAELRAYLVGGEGSWALGDEFLEFCGDVLAAGPDAARVALWRCVAAAALRDDVALLLHQDRRSHALMARAHRVDRTSLEEQRALALALCNLFDGVSSSEWLLYISEWGNGVSNMRATTKVGVHALLSEDAELQELGGAIVYNIATKDVKTVVFDEVSVELALCVLQALSLAPGEQLAWRLLAALARLAAHSADVPQLVAAVGPSPLHLPLRGLSARVDEQLDAVAKALRPFQ